MESSSVIRFVGAILCIILAVGSWIIMAEKLQGLFTNFPQCYFMVYWIHSWYSVMYVAWKGWKEFPGNCQCNSAGEGAITWKRALWTSGLIGFVGLVSAYFWYLSLSRTSVPANTAIYQSAVAFTFILSVPILKEKVTLVKIIAVTLSIGGVVLVAVYAESNKSGAVHQTPLGYVYLVVSTILFALMEVMYKRLATFNNDPASACNGVRFVGLMGIHTLVWMWPPLVILHFAGIERFMWPPTTDLLVLVFLNAILDVIFNASIFVAIALSSPLFATIGTVTAIPTSIVVDYFLHKTKSYYVVYIGMGLIAIGFVGFTVSEFIHLRREGKQTVTNNNTINSSRSSNEDSLIKSQPPQYSINKENESTNETDSLLLRKPISNLQKERWKELVLKYVV